jgi:hypothetical protein
MSIHTKITIDEIDRQRARLFFRRRDDGPWRFVDVYPNHAWAEAAREKLQQAAEESGRLTDDRRAQLVAMLAAHRGAKLRGATGSLEPMEVVSRFRGAALEVEE